MALRFESSDRQPMLILEVDLRPMPEPERLIDAVSDIFDALAATLADTRTAIPASIALAVNLSAARCPAGSRSMAM